MKGSTSDDLHDISYRGHVIRYSDRWRAYLVFDCGVFVSERETVEAAKAYVDDCLEETT